MEGTSIETTESQSQQDQLFSGLPNLGRVRTEKDDDMSKVRQVTKAKEREGYDVESVKIRWVSDADDCK